MTTRILLIAHAPLAHALRQCALHVFPDCEDDIVALDVQPNEPPEVTQAGAQILMASHTGPWLLLTDVFGATPCNVAQRLVDGVRSRLITGVNLPMLLRAVTYRKEELDGLVSRALMGGTQGVMQVTNTAPHNQSRQPRNDQEIHHHQQ